MNHLCPACQRVLYDRRLANCGYCGAKIPDKLRFSPERIAELEEEMASLEKERRRRAREAEEEASRGADGGPPVPGPFLW